MKHSKRENRVYVGNLSYDVKYRDLIEFMRGGEWGRFSGLRFFFLVCGGGALGGQPGLKFGPPGGKRELEPEPETGVKASGQMADGEFAHPPS